MTHCVWQTQPLLTGLDGDFVQVACKLIEALRLNSRLAGRARGVMQLEAETGGGAAWGGAVEAEGVG